MSADDATSRPQPSGRPVGEPLSLDRLLATFTAWSGADVLKTARRRALAAGNSEQAAALASRADTPTPMEALAAADELTSLLAAWRWHTVRAAREAGASWADIAAASGSTSTASQAEFVERVDRAAETAIAAGVEFHDQERYRDAARPDPPVRQHDPSQDTETDLDPEDSDMQRDTPQSDPANPRTAQSETEPESERVPAWPGWPSPDRDRPLAAISDRELITRAELDEAQAMTGIGGDAARAWADLEATCAEAERRAADQPPDSPAAQVAGYVNLVSEDHTGALSAEATSWRFDLDRVLPPADNETDSAARSVQQTAERVDARMTAGPPAEDGGFDLERLDEVTERWGYAVFDPDAPGGVREPSDQEYAELHANLAPSDADETEGAVLGSAADRPAGEWPASVEAQVDEVARRTADPTFDYDPAAEWGDPSYREPRSQLEADARTRHLDGLRADEHGSRTTGRPLTEVEEALVDAQQHAVLADRAHDHDPAAWNRVADLEALTDLQPLPARTTDAREHHGPEVDAEDALFRRALDQHLAADSPGREELIEDAVSVARDRFWTHFQTTDPQQALDLAQGQRRREDQQPTATEDRGAAAIARRLDEARDRLTLHQGTAAAEQAGVDEQRRAQLNLWSVDDRTDDGAQDGDEYLDCRLHTLDQPEGER